MTKNKSMPIVLLATGLLWAGLCQAQESTNTSGGNATGSGGTATYSVGQVVYTSNSGSTGTVTQGIQHAYEIFALGVTPEKLKIALTAFPNPTADILTMKISNYNNETLSYQLFDMQGRLLSHSKIVAEQTQINMSRFPNATYFINLVTQDNKQVQSFKIIKH